MSHLEILKKELRRAIKEHRLVSLRYDGYERLVEPHLYAVNETGHEVILAWQEDGGSASGEPTGWKFFTLDAIETMTVLEQTFKASRPDFNPHDRRMRKIYESA